MIQKGLEKEVREKEITFPQKVFLSRIELSILLPFPFSFSHRVIKSFFLKKRQKKTLLKISRVFKKEIRHRTTLPQSNMQYHRRWAPYRSCSGWERELQARYGHRKKM